MRYFIQFLILLTTFTGCGFLSTYNAENYNLQGLNYLQQRNYSESIKCFKQAAETKGITLQNRTNYTRNIAVTYSEFEMIDSARFYYKKAANLNPSDSYNYYVNMADVSIIDKNFAGSISLLEKAWKLNEKDMVVNNLLGLMYLGEYDTTVYDPKKALKYNIKAHEINKDRNTKFVVAKNYFLLEDYTNAELLFIQLKEEYPDDISYLATLVLIAERTNDTVKLEKLCNELRSKSNGEYDYLMDDEID